MADEVGSIDMDAEETPSQSKLRSRVLFDRINSKPGSPTKRGYDACELEQAQESAPKRSCHEVRKIILSGIDKRSEFPQCIDELNLEVVDERR